MLLIFFYLLFPLISSKKNFPSIKFTKGGIFGWFDALALMKKPFNNKKLFGFRLNSTDPDLSMVVQDISNHLNLHDLNISQKISDMISPKSTKLLLGGGGCSGKTGNSLQFCKMFGSQLDFTKIGITEENLNILLANLVGYMPTNLFFIIIASLSIIYYIVQIVLQYKFFKPKEYSDPSILSCIIFYAGDALVFISAILFLCAFTGVDDLVSTIVSLDTIIPRITYSVSTSMLQLFEDAIPNGLNPLFQMIDSILNTTNFYIKSTVDSFINPTTLFLDKMVSCDPNDLGVFSLYNEKIKKKADEFYAKISENPKLKDIGRLFLSRDFTNEQNKFTEFYTSELDLSKEMEQLDSLFVYFDKVAQSFEDYVMNFTNKTMGDDENQTFGEMLYELKDNSLNSYEFLADLHKRTKKKNPLWIFLAIIFFVIGIFFMVVPIFLGLIFWMHNKVARCTANTIAICPLVSTILMFALAFLTSGIGFALVAVSNQFEARVDDLLSNIIDQTIPTREILIGPINITEETNGNYNGLLNITSIVFPKPLNNFQKFVKHDEDDGIASAFTLDDLIDIEKFGDEVGNFIINMSGNYNLPSDLLNSLNNVQSLLMSISSILPNEIDGLFNWFVKISVATNYLRDQIKSKDSSALESLEPFLNEIDVLTNQMNSQYKIAMKQLTVELPTAIDDLNALIPRFIKSILNDLGTSMKQLVRNVYPVVDSIQCGVILGPYALVRNAIFYDLSNMCAFISASGTLMIFGLVVVVTMIWIRRTGMMHVTGREIGFFEFIFTCRKKKVANDHSCDSMETDDSNIIYLHDSDFDIETSYCNSEFEVNSKSYHFDNKDFDDCNNWCIGNDDVDVDENSGLLHLDNKFNASDDCSNWSLKTDPSGNFIPKSGGFVCAPEDNNDNFTIKADNNGNFKPDQNGFKCDPSDDCSNWSLQIDKDGNLVHKTGGFVCDPEDDNDNFCIVANNKGKFEPDDKGFKCDPEDDNNNFIVRLNRDGTIYNNKFGDDHPIKDNINDVGDAFLGAMKDNVSEDELDTEN